MKPFLKIGNRTNVTISKAMRILSTIPAIFLAIASVNAAEVKISDLPETNAPSASSVLPIVDAGVTWKVQKNNLLGSLTNWAKLSTNAAGGTQLWTNLPSLTDMEGGTVYGGHSTNASGIEAIAWANGNMPIFGYPGSILSLGANTPTPTVFATNNYDVVSLGDSANNGLSLDRCWEILTWGEYAQTSSHLTNCYAIFTAGDSAGLGQKLDGVSGAYFLGTACGISLAATNSGLLYFIGDATGSNGVFTNAHDIFNISDDTTAQVVSDSTQLFNVGFAAGNGQHVSASSQGIYNIGSHAGESQVLSGVTDAYFLGDYAGASLTLTGKSHVMVVGSGGKATNSNDFVFGDNAYNYFFPGASSRFDHDMTLMDGLTLGGVRRTSWPSGSGDNWTASGTTNSTLSGISTAYGSVLSDGNLRFNPLPGSTLIFSSGMPEVPDMGTSYNLWKGGGIDVSTNVIHALGLNVTAGGVDQSGKSAAGWWIESNYRGGAELYWQVFDRAGNSRRPIFYTHNITNLFSNDGMSFQANSIALNVSNNIPAVACSINAGMPQVNLYGSVVYQGSSGGQSAFVTWTPVGYSPLGNMTMQAGDSYGFISSAKTNFTIGYHFNSMTLYSDNTSSGFRLFCPADGTATAQLGDGSALTSIKAANFVRSVGVGTGVTLGATNEVYLCNVDGQTVTLPTAVGARGRNYTIKTITPSATATIATTSSQLIDGASTYSLSASNKFVRVIADGTNWWIIGSN